MASTLKSSLVVFLCVGLLCEQFTLSTAKCSLLSFLLSFGRGFAGGSSSQKAGTAYCYDSTKKHKSDKCLKEGAPCGNDQFYCCNEGPDDLICMNKYDPKNSRAPYKCQPDTKKQCKKI